MGLAFIAAVRVYRLYEEHVQQQQEGQPPTMTFNNVPVQQTPPPVEESVLTYWREAPQEIYLEDAPLAPQQQKEQASATVRSILNDYKDNPEIQDFYADLRQATGRDDIDLTALSGEKLPQLLAQYPQLQQVVAKHAQNPAFVRTLQEIFQNPQFVQSIVVLQGAKVAGGSSEK